MDQDQAEMKRLHAIIEGRVQGVGYRYFVEEVAYQLNLTGWVRNRWDGSVEVVAEGTPQNLNLLLSALRRGPRSAVVTNITEEWLDATGEFKSFYIRSTSF